MNVYSTAGYMYFACGCKTVEAAAAVPFGCIICRLQELSWYNYGYVNLPSLLARPSLAGVATDTAPSRGIVCVLRLGPPWGAGLSEWPESNRLVHTSPFVTPSLFSSALSPPPSEITVWLLVPTSECNVRYPALQSL